MDTLMKMFRHIHVFFAAVLVLSLTVAARAQMVGDIVLSFQPELIGLGGVVRTGQWMPLRITVQNRSGVNRPVICRWLFEDADGDMVISERHVVLNPNRVQHVWLYGSIHAGFLKGDGWKIQIVDQETGQHLQAGECKPFDVIHGNSTLIGLLGYQEIGLSPYSYPETRHEVVKVSTGLTLSNLPDRWYGLAGYRSLIWTREGGEPIDAGFTVESQRAVRQWVRRGGHLVISLPVVGQSWTESGLADLLPVGKDRMKQVQQLPPLELGHIATIEPVPLDYTVFDIDPSDPVAVIATDRDDRPYLISRRYGFGRVTLIGVDLVDHRLAAMGMPSGRYRIWNHIFHWQSPAYTREAIESALQSKSMVNPQYCPRHPLGKFVPGLLAMRNTVGMTLLLIILVFSLYWLTSGPLSFLVLKRRQMTMHSWLVFLTVICLFSVLTWGGAFLMRPGKMRIIHFTVLDADAGTGLVHARSWQSIFIPTFGRADIMLEPTKEDEINLISSPGMERDLSGGFLDTQQYTIESTRPDGVSVPYRSTTKQFKVDYLGYVDREVRGLAQPWYLPQGRLKLTGRPGSRWPVGELTHDLPAPLEDVLLVYCYDDPHRQNHRVPHVWRIGEWRPGRPLKVRLPAQADKLVIPPLVFDSNRKWQDEGFLGRLMGEFKTGATDSSSRQYMIQKLEMLSFYDALPPPLFSQSETFSLPPFYTRYLDDNMDITPLIAGRRLIVIGHIENSSLPIPVSVNGRTVESTGWTMVRWIYDFEEDE